MLITLSSDFIYVLAMLKTSPLVVTVGISLTVPLAVIGDILLAHPVKAQVVLGACLVVAAFAIIGVEDAKKPRDDVVIVKPEDDPYINLAKESSLAFTTLLDFFIVNHFPARKCTTNVFFVQ